jgi:hypothetical protein
MLRPAPTQKLNNFVLAKIRKYNLSVGQGEAFGYLYFG